MDENKKNGDGLEVDLKVEIISSTKQGFILPKEEALKFGVQSAAICYMKESFEDIQKEDVEKTKARIKRTLKSGHQSVYDHTHYNLLISGLPKILAMVLNNEKMYTTSEKSARYTQLEVTPIEKEMYNKWMKIFEQKIEKTYPQIPQNKREKLAQENARYLTSVFTPTIMEYTVSFRQLNYIMHWFNEFIKTKPESQFNQRIKKGMEAFNKQMKDFYTEELDPSLKLRKLTLFAKRNDFKESFDETYSTNYNGSFAFLAQAHRHRTINYQMQPIEEHKLDFFIPPILKDNDKTTNEWKNDMEAVAHLYPQATLLEINERGTYENFISKAAERLCGQAQLEIMHQTKKTLTEYILATEKTNPSVHEELTKYGNGPKCTFPGYSCPSPCLFGSKSLERLI